MGEILEDSLDPTLVVLEPTADREHSLDSEMMDDAEVVAVASKSSPDVQNVDTSPDAPSLHSSKPMNEVVSVDVIENAEWEEDTEDEDDEAVSDENTFHRKLRKIES